MVMKDEGTNKVLMGVEPDLKQIQIYFDQKGFSEKEAHRFFEYYKVRNWLSKRGLPIKNWRQAALEWLWRLISSSPYLRIKLKT